jgi:hypothetical protein
LEDQEGFTKTPEEIFAELDSLIGISKVKKFVRQLYAQVQLDKERAEKGMQKTKHLEPLHMVFTGNPGTGMLGGGRREEGGRGGACKKQNTLSLCI